MENDPINESEGCIEVDNEMANSFKEQDAVSRAVYQSAHSESLLDSQSDATMMTEYTSGSSVEDIPSSKSCKCVVCALRKFGQVKYSILKEFN